jgi:hypothetical protein
VGSRICVVHLWSASPPRLHVPKIARSSHFQMRWPCAFAGVRNPKCDGSNRLCLRAGATGRIRMKRSWSLPDQRKGAATGGAPNRRTRTVSGARAPGTRLLRALAYGRSRTSAQERREARPRLPWRSAARRGGALIYKPRRPSEGSANRTVRDGCAGWFPQSMRRPCETALDGVLSGRAGGSRRQEKVDGAESGDAATRGRLARPRPPCTAAQKKRSRRPSGHTTPSHN